METENRSAVVGGWGRAEWGGDDFMGVGFGFGVMKLLELDRSDSRTTS